MAVLIGLALRASKSSNKLGGHNISSENTACQPWVSIDKFLWLS